MEEGSKFQKTELTQFQRKVQQAYRVKMAVLSCYLYFIVWLLIIVGTSAKREIHHTPTGVQVMLDSESTWQLGDNRRRRQAEVTGLTAEDHTLVLNKHNELRAQEGSSDMLMLVRF